MMHSICAVAERPTSRRWLAAADWVRLKCGNYNTKTKKCGGA